MGEVPQPTGTHALALHHLQQLRSCMRGLGLTVRVSVDRDAPEGYRFSYEDLEGDIRASWERDWAEALKAVGR